MQHYQGLWSYRHRDKLQNKFILQWAHNEGYFHSVIGSKKGTTLWRNWNLGYTCKLWKMSLVYVTAWYKLQGQGTKQTSHTYHTFFSPLNHSTACFLECECECWCECECTGVKTIVYSWTPDLYTSSRLKPLGPLPLLLRDTPPSTLSPPSGTRIIYAFSFSLWTKELLQDSMVLLQRVKFIMVTRC